MNLQSKRAPQELTIDMASKWRIFLGGGSSLTPFELSQNMICMCDAYSNPTPLPYGQR